MRRSTPYLGSGILRLLRFFLHDPKLLLRYVSAGGIAAGVEIGLFVALYQGLHWPLLVANTLALSCALLLCFALQKQWTFATKGGLGRELKLYLLMQIVSGLLNNLLIVLFVTHWAWQPLVAKVVQIGIVFMWNFSFCKLVIFKATASAPGARSLQP